MTLPKTTTIALALVAALRLDPASLGGQNPPEVVKKPGSVLPAPLFHHIHINSTRPERSLEWYAQYWPNGKKTTYAGFPAFTDGQGFYLLYTQVPKQAPPTGCYCLQVWPADQTWAAFQIDLAHDATGEQLHPILANLAVDWYGRLGSAIKFA